MSNTPQYTHRDRIKFACFSYALEQGLDENQMIDLFNRAADTVRRVEKTAGSDSWQWSDITKGLGTIAGVTGAALAAPLVISGFGHAGYAAGQGLKRLSTGRAPEASEIHLIDETAEFERAREEVRRRIILNRIKKQQEQSPSNRRMF